jgi:D-arabinose 1-dehydrogenase-like Zn-dependent alcohol dehydrogenase
MQIPDTMTAARMHKVGGEQLLERLPVPKPGSMDVLIRVRACGIVPNLGNILANWTSWFPHLPLPPLPAVFGLDPTGEIAALGAQVHGVKVGDRVYVNPGRACGSCRHCVRGDQISCRRFAFQGYFGFSKEALSTQEDYPIGGLSEYMVAPASALVQLPDNLSFDLAARFGYTGTAYSALKKTQAGPGDAVLINGASGTLGLGGVISALALGVDRILGTARNKTLLERVKAIAPDRIEVFSTSDGSITDWALGLTGKEGVDAFIDCQGPGAPAEALVQGIKAVRRGGTVVDIGAVAGDVPIDLHWLMDRNIKLFGSLWFTTREGQEMAALAKIGRLDMSVYKTVACPLEDVNRAISGIETRDGGFSNFVIVPN